MGVPERLALRFFIFLEYVHLGRIEASLIWIAVFIVLSFIVTVVITKEVHWNNKHLNLDVIQFNGDSIKVNNYHDERLIPIAGIEKVSLMNKDSVLEIKFKDKKSVTADYLADCRKTYESLKDILSPLNPKIEFFDFSVQSKPDKK